MPLITFLPRGKSLAVPAGTDLTEAAQSAGIDIETPCGGRGACGKCIVKIHDGSAQSDSLGLLSREEIDAGLVAACKTKITDSPLTVEILTPTEQDGGQFADDAETHAHEPDETHKTDPWVVKWNIRVEPPAEGDGFSDLDRLTRALREHIPQEDKKDPENLPVEYTLPVIRSMADALRAEGGRVTVTVAREPRRYRIIDIGAGECKDGPQHQLYGIAVDVGTTTVAVRLVSTTTGAIIATATDYNGQTVCGSDVISRINYARKPERLEELRRRVTDTINRLTNHLAETHGISPQTIYSASIAGNTTMIHLLLGLNPEYIRLEPYTPTIFDLPPVSAGEAGLAIHDHAPVIFSPAVGSYVGGDITAGLLCTDFAADSTDIDLFIDIGTNGELVIGNNEFLMTCACSAGPAFEGGGIGRGMRAAHGAVEAVDIDAATGRAQYHTIGNAPPRGICGSGMISLLAELFLTGLIDGAGKLNRDGSCDSIIIEGRQAKYVIAPAEESADGRALVVEERDIENIIRSKAAIYSACGLMLQQVGLDFNDLAKIYIAGGFGRFLDIEKAIIIGLLPDVPREKYRYIGNSSLKGAYRTLLSRQCGARRTELAHRMTYIELNTDPGYMDRYTGALFLPHTDSGLFPSVETLKASRTCAP